MANKIVYSSKIRDLTIGGKSVIVKGVTPPAKQKWQHEDDMQGGGVVEQASYERQIQFTIGVRADGSGGFDWESVEDAEIILYYMSGKKRGWRNCYFKEAQPGEFTGQGAATESISIIVGEELSL